MRFIITATTDDSAPNAGAGADADFDPAIFQAYMKFNEDLHNAGVLVASEGLLPGSPGARVAVVGGQRQVVDGPFAESKELIGGFYVIDVPTFEDAKAWALRCPLGMASADVLEVRQLTGEADIPQPFLELAASVAPNWTASFTKKK